ncbi:MAG: 2-C-methyl-D-erythritol 4-phosphate cytidylyltransferase, partial [Chthoniobacterales bacterium]|nr:2-C-methyl-D-erythritol 4-phosphate cytidylyltransferase [Chthoniobacterales bacterium]
GGSSLRFGSDKLMASLLGRPLITYSVLAFVKTPIISSIILVVPSNREEEFQRVIDSLKNPRLSEIIRIIPGGESRHASVQRGLIALSDSCAFVAIHDAARPLITQDQIDRVCKAAYSKEAAALALPVTETLHRSDASGYAQETIDRHQLWSMQTPQVFRLKEVLRIIHEDKKSLRIPTDEVSALLAHGIKTTLIENREPNIKVTYQEDLRIVKAFLENSSQ